MIEERRARESRSLRDELAALRRRRERMEEDREVIEQLKAIASTAEKGVLEEAGVS